MDEELIWDVTEKIVKSLGLRNPGHADQ
jgi:hypothetical protein